MAHICNGQTEGELTALGKDQANLLGKRLYDTLFDFVYCSDLHRTKQTCSNILFHQPQDTDMSVFYCKEIREINVNGVEGKSWELEQKIRYWADNLRNAQRIGKSHHNGRSDET